MPVFPKRKSWCLLLALLITHSTFAQITKQQERNLTAFAKLYGYTRYFYPGDEARQIDWDQFAVYGSKEIIGQPNDAALVTKLKQLFLPVAPAITLAQGKLPAFSLKQITPPNIKNFKPISWQHSGYYEGLRLNRRDNRSKKELRGDFDFMMVADVTQLRGKKFVLVCNLGATKNWKGATLKVIKDNEQMRLQPMSAQQITDSLAHDYKIEGTIGDNIDKLIIGFLSDKNMKFTIKSRLYIKGNDKLVEIPIKQLESYDKLSNNDGIMRYGVVVEQQNIDNPLFAAKTKIGEHVSSELVKGIYCTMPLVVYGNTEYTYPRGNSPALAQLQKDITNSKSIGKNEQATYLADVIIARNVYQHFFDYWDDASKTPSAILHGALVKAASDKTEADIFYTLKLINAALNDGHMFYNPPNVPGASLAASLPLVFAKAEGKIVVKFVLDNTLAAKIHPGDVIDSINGQDALAYYRNQLQYVSGSPQFKEFNALAYLGGGEPNSSMQLVTLHNGMKNKMTVPRSQAGLAYREGAFNPKPVKDGEIKSGVFYYNLSNKGIDSIFNSHLDRLTKAKGIILDLRGYPQSDILPIIQRLMTKEENDKWLHIAQIIYPDHQKQVYPGFGWNLRPMQPHISTKTYLLTDASAMSASDSYSGYFKDLKLATVVGQPTAGTNGQIVSIKLPGGRDQWFSGMLVTNHDGSKHHLKGIVPDVLVYPTIKGITAARDEVLDKAVELAEGK